MISFELTEDQQILQETVRKFATDVLRPKMRECEQARAVDDSLRKKFHELGLTLLDVPENFGGQGLGMTTAVLVHEELAFGDPGLAVALWAPHMATSAILELGSDEQKKRFLPPFGARAGLLGAVAYSERWKVPEAGFATAAQAHEGAIRLTGIKSFVVNGGQSDLTVVFAQRDAARGWEGISAFVVDKGTPGVQAGSRHDLLGLAAVQAAEVIFEGCSVSPDRELAQAASLLAVRRFFDRVALINAARQIGLARAAYEFALGYTQDRKAFGKPIAHFQSIAFTLADMHMDVEAARGMVWRAAASFDAGATSARLDVAKGAAHANEAAWRVADNAVQLLGGAGYIQDYPVEKWMRDTKALALFGPSDQLLALQAAGEGLGRPDDFGPGLPTSDVQPIFT